MRDERRVFLERVGSISRTLCFKVNASSNVTAWTEAVRSRLNFRGNAFVDDVPLVAEWLWKTDASYDERARRLGPWRAALPDGDFAALREEGICRSDWWSRLAS